MKFFKPIFATLILLAAFWFIGWKDIAGSLEHIELGHVAFLVVLSMVMIWVSCVKWQLFIRAYGHEISIWRLMRLYIIGYFFNTFMPSFIGGDIARGYQLGGELSNPQEGFITTFLERLTGLWAMTLLGLLFVITGADATAGVELSIILLAVFVTIASVACFSERGGRLILDLLQRISKIIKIRSVEKGLSSVSPKVSKALAACRSRPALIAHAMVLSVIFHSLTVVNTYVAARAIGWHSANFQGMFIVVPLVLIVSMIPLTPSGIGIQEGAFAYFMERIGATQAQGFSIGVILRLKVIIIAIIGAAIWSLSGKRSKKTITTTAT